MFPDWHPWINNYYNLLSFCFPTLHQIHRFCSCKVYPWPLVRPTRCSGKWRKRSTNALTAIQRRMQMRLSARTEAVSGMWGVTQVMFPCTYTDYFYILKIPMPLLFFLSQAALIKFHGASTPKTMDTLLRPPQKPTQAWQLILLETWSIGAVVGPTHQT